MIWTYTCFIFVGKCGSEVSAGSCRLPLNQLSVYHSNVLVFRAENRFSMLMSNEMEALDTNAKQRRETFARYGLAMYHAQCVEKSLAILVSMVFNKEFLPSDPKRREEIQEELFARTIGRLVTRMKKQISVPPHLDQTLEDARQKRNWLAHEYFWERAGEVMTIRGRNKMIDELTELSDFFSEVDAHLVSIYKKWMKKLGIPQVVVDEGLKKLIIEHE